MRAREFILEDWNRQQLVYKPAEKDPWLRDPEMARARAEKRDYEDAEGRVWSFSQNDMGFRNYQGLRKPKNIPGVNITPVNMAGKRVYHCTNKIQSIQKTGGLKPKIDITGENEYGRLSTHFDPFIPAKGIWVTAENEAKWVGKQCVSFVVEPDDQVAKAYGVGLLVLNPIPWDRLRVEQ